MHLLLLLLVAAVSATASPAAAEILAQVVPVKCSLSGRAGEALEREILVQNGSGEAMVVRVSLSDWSLGPRGELRLLPAGSGPRSLDGLVRVEPESFTLPPGASRALRLSVTVPADGPAARWGVVLSQFRPVIARPASLGPVAIAEMGTTVYLNRSDGARARAEIAGMEMSHAPGDSIRVTARLLGAGELPLYFRARLSLTDGLGRRGVETALPTTLLLPGHERLFEVTLPAPAAPGACIATCTVDSGEPELLVGELPFRWPPAPAAPLAGPTLP